MSKYQTINHEQLELLEREASTKQPAKHVNIVSLKLVRESIVLYKERQIKSPEDVYRLKVVEGDSNLQLSAKKVIRKGSITP